MKNIITLFLVSMMATGVSAAIPDGYYNRLNGKNGAALKQAVHEVINPHTTVSSYSNLPKYFQVTDVYPRSDKWWDMYSNVT
ncbi:MAG: ribonuclease, partial [Muribaculaceae bacterium]|nr:ribonuclease [Muribaculaceae bacterium]